MFRLYQMIASRLSAFLAHHEKDLFTTGANLLVVGCLILAVFLARRCLGIFS